ncbi:MAG: MMPL family transporter [Thermoanaerobaculia bacterium]
MKGPSFLQHIALFARHQYRTVFLLTGILVAISLGLILRLTFDPDILSLLPRKNPAVRAYIETLQDFGSSTLLIIAVRIPEGAVAEPYETFSDELAARLSKLPELKQVEHRIGDPEELLRTFFPKSVLFLNAEGRSQLAARLTDDGIRRRVAELRRQLSTPEGLAVKQLAKLDPLGLAQIFLGRVESSRGSLQVDWTSGYYLSRDHRMLLILAEPTRPPQNLKFNERLVTGIRRVVAGTLADWSRIVGSDAPARPRVDLGGAHLTALSDSSLIRYDMMVNIITSALGVLLLFLFAFRRIGTLVYAFLPLLCGLIITFGFAKVAVGALSSATSVVAALLIGLGIDFVIVSYGRYVEERRRGATVEAALMAMSGLSGRAVLAGAVTTTATFYAFTFTDFVGLRQMGLLTGTGILFCATSVLVLLPAMLAWSEDHHQRRRTAPNLFLHSFGSDVLMRYCIRHRRIAFLAGVAISAVALGFALFIRFDESMKTMRPQGNEGLDVTAEVGRTFGSGFDSMTILLSGSSPGEVLTLAGRAAAGARKLVDQGVLYGYSGVTSLIPPPAQQTEVLQWLEAERHGVLDLGRIQTTFAAAVNQQGMRLEPFEPGLDLLARAVNLSGPIGVDDFRQSKQTQLLLDRFLKKTDRGWRGAVLLYPPGNKWRREAPPEALALGRSLGPNVTLTGTNVVNQVVKQQVLRDAWVAGVLGYLVVAIILWINFRTLRHTFMALAPLTLGILWMVGSMSALGIQMNFINIFVTTMIIGIGVDYGIYVIHRYLEVRDAPDEEFERGILETSKAVLAAATCTIVGFGSITFSHYPGLISTGKVAVLGALCTSLVAITLLPTFLSWRRDVRKQGLSASPRPR